VAAAKEIVAPADLLAACNIRWQEEVRDLDVVELVALRPDRIAHFIPVENVQFAATGIRPMTHRLTSGSAISARAS